MSSKSAMISVAVVMALNLGTAAPSAASPFFFSTGTPDGKIATASGLNSPGSFEIETADDFVLTQATDLTGATFTGLIPERSSALSVAVEIYRVFPKDSDVSLTSGSPTFSTSKVPTRVNSPSDVAFDVLDSSGGALNFSTNVLSSSFTASNSVLPGGIHPKPSQTTGGNGPVTGDEVEFTVTFTAPLSLSADHYFFVPVVQLNSGDFLWLSAPKPIIFPGTPFPAGSTDLQSWIRDQDLDPDWLRIGTDIVGGSPAPTFNAAFSLTGATNTVSEPSSLLLFGTALAALGVLRRRRKVAT